MPVFTITVKTNDITIAQLKAVIDAMVANGLDIRVVARE